MVHATVIVQDRFHGLATSRGRSVGDGAMNGRAFRSNGGRDFCVRGHWPRRYLRVSKRPKPEAHTRKVVLASSAILAELGTRRKQTWLLISKQVFVNDGEWLE